MAVDTLAKREAITNFLMPGFASIAWPTGVVDRASAMWLYPMGAAAATPEVSLIFYLLFAVESTKTLEREIYSTKTYEHEVT